MTEIVKSEYQEARELVAGETFMVGNQQALHWAENPIHRAGLVFGVKTWWVSPKKGESKWMEHPIRLEADCWISMEIQAQDLRLGDYIATEPHLAWHRILEIQMSMGGATLLVDRGGVIETVGMSEDTQVKVVRK